MITPESGMSFAVLLGVIAICCTIGGSLVTLGIFLWKDRNVVTRELTENKVHIEQIKDGLQRLEDKIDTNYGRITDRLDKHNQFSSRLAMIEARHDLEDKK